MKTFNLKDRTFKEITEDLNSSGFMKICSHEFIFGESYHLFHNEKNDDYFILLKDFDVFRGNEILKKANKIDVIKRIGTALDFQKPTEILKCIEIIEQNRELKKCLKAKQHKIIKPKVKV